MDKNTHLILFSALFLGLGFVLAESQDSHTTDIQSTTKSRARERVTHLHWVQIS